VKKAEPVWIYLEH